MRFYFIYLMLIPIVLLDLFLIVYHFVFYRKYMFFDLFDSEVRRKDYIVIDRHKINGLSLKQKINCLYCDYFNGVLSYGLELAGLTEQLFCPYKNNPQRKNAHAYYQNFRACDGCIGGKKDDGTSTNKDLTE